MDSEDTLVNEGWEVRHVGVVQNPGTWTAKAQTGYPPRFWAVYTKLMVFNLTEYSTGAPHSAVLDARLLVVSASPHLCRVLEMFQVHFWDIFGILGIFLGMYRVLGICG